MRWSSLALAGISLVALLVNGAVDVVGAPVPPTPVAIPSPPGPALQMRVRVGSPLPAQCGFGETVGIVTGFVAAFNRGDQAALARFFPAEPTGSEPIGPGKFGWFAVTGAPGSFNPGFIAWNRDDLLPYLAARHAAHERLDLLQIEVAGSWDDGAGMVFDVARQADDLPAHVAGGEGTLDCEAGTIIVWNLGDREGLTDFINPPPLPTCPAAQPRCE